METKLKSVSNLSYVVVPTKLTKAGHGSAEQNAIYEFWLRHWSEAFRATGDPEDGWQSHFLKQDVAVGLRAGDEIISCHLYSLYDLRSKASLESEYFSYLPPLAIATLRERGLINLLSMEYLGVSPEWSRNEERVSLGKLMIALGSHVGEAMGVDAVFGTPISSTKVDAMMYDIGGETIARGIPKFGYDLILQYAPTSPRVPSVNAGVRDLAQSLWDRRFDATTVTSRPDSKRRTA